MISAKSKETVNKVKKVKKIITIRTKLISAIAACCVVLLAINGAMIIKSVKKNSDNTMSQLLFAESDKVSTEANAYFDKYITLAQVVATDPTIQRYLTSTQNGISITENREYVNEWKM